MTELSFVINYPQTKKGKSEWTKAYGLNAYYSGKHWSIRNRDSEFWHSIVRLELARQRIRLEEMLTPVEVEVTFDDGLDVDNHAVMTKYIIDSLKGGLFHDDSRKYVARSIMGFNDENLIKVSVRSLVDNIAQ